MLGINLHGLNAECGLGQYAKVPVVATCAQGFSSSFFLIRYEGYLPLFSLLLLLHQSSCLVLTCLAFQRQSVSNPCAYLISYLLLPEVLYLEDKVHVKYFDRPQIKKQEFQIFSRRKLQLNRNWLFADDDIDAAVYPFPVLTARAPIDFPARFAFFCILNPSKTANPISLYSVSLLNNKLWTPLLPSRPSNWSQG